MSTICIDLGTKRCGIAVMKENIAFAHEIVARSGLMRFLKKYIEQNDIDTIIVGLPYDLYGKDTKRLKKTEDFIEKLKNLFTEIDVLGHDERFSSFAAQEEGCDDHRDDIAAQCILQSYIDSINKK